MGWDSAKSDSVGVEVMGNIAEVTLDRPPVNALATSTYTAMAAVFDRFGRRDDIDCVVLASAHPTVFCAGADLKEVDGMDPGAAVRRQEAARRLLLAVRHCAVPVIAAVEGKALGAGAAIAACADIRVAGSAATFAMPEVAVGRAGGGRHLMRLMGQGAVRRLYFTAQPIDATEAFRVGLVDELVEPGQARPTALRLAATIAQNSPMALRLAKEALNLSESMAVDDGYQLEQQYTLRLGHSGDAAEAQEAFREKRPPRWRGTASPSEPASEEGTDGLQPE